MDVSVILCTHNPRTIPLARALAAVRAQTMASDRWEFCLVDNGSTRSVAESVDFDGHPESAFCVREDRLGLTWARLRGISETTGRVLVFLDDDNVPAEDYLDRALEVNDDAPHLGAWGSGQLQPEFETEPSTELTPLLSMLALRAVSRSIWSSNPKDWSCMPWGAGLCVARDVAQAYVALLEDLKVHEMFGRRGTGQQLWQGDDDLFSMAAVRCGRGFGVFPQLRITHLIAATRLNQSYFLRLIHDHALSHGVIDYLIFGEQPRRQTASRHLRRFLHGMKRGLFAMRCRAAADTGLHDAAEFIRTHNLSHLNVFGAQEWRAPHLERISTHATVAAR